MTALRHLFTAALIALSVPAIATAAPADVAGAVASADRPAEAVELDAGRKPAEVLTFLGLERGDRVLDLMAGSGYYTEIMARAVGPKGSVIALEPPIFYDGDDKAKANWAALRQRNPNVSLQLQMPGEIALAPNSLDLTLMHLVYHDAYWESEKYKYPRLDPDSLLRKIFAATKPGGIVGVIDHVAAPGGDTRQVVDKLHRIDPAVVRADFERAGFVLDGESDLLRVASDDKSKLVFDPAVRGKTDRFVYRFRKPAR